MMKSLNKRIIYCDCCDTLHGIKIEKENVLLNFILFIKWKSEWVNLWWIKFVINCKILKMAFDLVYYTKNVIA